ncbi:MAG: Methyltransferase, UbiE/COQ5 family [Parcubacteria group bacterium GW2011_GWC2_38_7]|nr:MAG: Methyltransferase, UbiE/COQ5 family [Parcubacteria group bacterium GW2011_GWC2_38_7]
MEKQISENIKAHNRLADKYESRHPEIYNEIEQARLKDSLRLAVESIQTENSEKKVLDFGCGAGNLTKYLLELGVNVVAADLAPEFLRLVENRFNHAAKLRTAEINGVDLRNFADNEFDLVSIFSVLHHVPDYLSILREFVRVTKPGGIIFIDREMNENYWSDNLELKKLYSYKTIQKSWTRFLKLQTWINRFKKFQNPRFQEEGDIHVWPDDHINQNEVDSVLLESCEIVRDLNYLHFDSRYPKDLWQEVSSRLNDTRCLIVRKVKK